ncbi:D-amino-acid transaminase [Corticicoccus populi]|uniref:D-alanine aminotransferase n=1 Tax=Corticicoccus populi TaxID=1812821 RepID=A0ABW5WUH4_9STAP
MKISYYNGEFINDDDMKVEYKDRAVYFGDGVYEVIRIYDGEFFTFDEHVDRLINSAREIDIDDLEREDVVSVLQGIKEKNNIENGALYIQVTRGIAVRNHNYPAGVEPVIMAYINEAVRPLTQQEAGVNVVTSLDYRWLKCHIKSLNLLANVLEKERAVKAGAKETILHREGTVTEGSSTNAFIVKDDVLITHPANNLILNGITRQEVLKLAKADNVEVKEEAFSVDDLYEADEAFFTSTTQEITPIVQVDNKLVKDGEVGTLTKRLQNLFDSQLNKLNPVKQS